MNCKSCWKSRTLWINGLVMLTAWFLNHKGIMSAAGVDADTQVTVLAIVNFINRFFTTQAIVPQGETEKATL